MGFPAGVAIDGDGLGLPESGRVPGLTHRRIDTGEISQHVVLAGEGDGPLVVLLHGFPDFWWGWRYQIPALVKAGFRVAVPDLRGYNLSDQPPNVGDYAISHLVSDVEGLIDSLGEKSAHVVGHDWGGAVAWQLAMRHPERVNRLAIVNCPHPKVLVRALVRSPVQLRRSWYMFFFQLPHLPELMLQQNNYAALRKTNTAGRLVRPGPDEVEPYIDAARRSDSLRGGLNYYRAMFRGGRALMRDKPARIDHEVLVVWGERDIALGKELATPPKRLVSNARVEFLPEASHWPHTDAPSRVNGLLVPFLLGPTN